MKDILDVHPAVLTLSFARMAESVGNSFLIIILPLYISSGGVGGEFFGLSKVAITGIVLSLFGFVNSSLQPFTGRFSDRLGKRKIFVLVGLFLLGISSLCYTISDQYWHLISLRVIQGAAGALIIPITLALVNDLTEQKNRGGNMGTYNTFRLLGFGLGPVGAGFVVEAGPYHLSLGERSISLSGFNAAFSLAAGTALVSFLMVFFLIFDPNVETTSRKEQKQSSLSILDSSGQNILDPVFTLGVTSFLMATGIALYATLGDIINKRLDQGAEMFGLQFGAFILAQVFVQAPIGRATDYYGRKRFIVLGMLLLIPTTFLQGIIMNSWIMFADRFLQGVAGAMVFAPAMALAGDLAGEGKSGTTLSVLTMGFGYGIACGPVLSGFLVEFGFPVPFIFGAFVAAFGAILVQTQVQETVQTPPGEARESAN